MQRLASSRRLLQAALAAAAVAAPAPANGAFPKMPAFDYTPPPYDGPRAEIFGKRAQFLSPSLFHFYDRPVRVPLPHRHSSLQFCGKDYTATTKKKKKL
jgi:alanine-glyoxylate transaminase / (R)-3-amino-2-methylpropionate-pyruvate transaminase